MEPHADIGYLIFVLFARMLYLFLYCYFGKLTTDNYKDMAYSLYECNWQDLPVNLQKYFILMIGNASIPVEYNGFGIAVLNLETYTRVRKIKIKNMISIIMTIN